LAIDAPAWNDTIATSRLTTAAAGEGEEATADRKRNGRVCVRSSHTLLVLRAPWQRIPGARCPAGPDPVEALDDSALSGAGTLRRRTWRSQEAWSLQARSCSAPFLRSSSSSSSFANWCVELAVADADLQPGQVLAVDKPL
jgi:hypothetical protein